MSPADKKPKRKVNHIKGPGLASSKAKLKKAYDTLLPLTLQTSAKFKLDKSAEKDSANA